MKYPETRIYNQLMVELAGKTITLTINLYSWMAETLGAEEARKQTARLKLSPGTTVLDLFTDLANRYPKFRETIFNPDTGFFSDQVLVILSGKLVHPDNFANTVIQDNDRLSLSPVLVGG